MRASEGPEGGLAGAAWPAELLNRGAPVRPTPGPGGPWVAGAPGWAAGGRGILLPCGALTLETSRLFVFSAPCPSIAPRTRMFRKSEEREGSCSGLGTGTRIGTLQGRNGSCCCSPGIEALLLSEWPLHPFFLEDAVCEWESQVVSLAKAMPGWSWGWGAHGCKSRAPAPHRSLMEHELQDSGNLPACRSCAARRPPAPPRRTVTSLRGGDSRGPLKAVMTSGREGGSVC